ncbi:MAG: SPOR domain-containing protein [Moraxellaceae bacterium]|jgi:DedD protein|nr:SPOR domain-containing protein [Moraxellaceae bacterium]
MMEKAIKQRLVGGLVLIAGAALFLPMVLDGSGSDLVVPPMPQPPKVANVEDIQPHLESEIAAASASVDAAQAGPVFHEVVPAATASAVEDVAPDDAYALAQAPAQAATATATAVIAPSVADKQAQARLATDKAAAAEADRAAAKKAEADRLAREKIEKERLEAGKKAQEAKQKVAQLQAAAKPVAVAPLTAPAKPAANLPEAWVVQVASLSARDKADELVTRLRAKGFRATVVHQSGNWKVLVGPELRKEVAESIKQRLATDPELKLSGWVQAWKP